MAAVRSGIDADVMYTSRKAQRDPRGRDAAQRDHGVPQQAG